MTDNFSDVVEQWRKNSPRVNGLADKFLSIATGNSGVPYRTPLDDNNTAELFQGDAAVLSFYEECRQRFGTFGHHFISSIPYALQEWARLGSALTMYLYNISETECRPSYFHSVGSAEGVIARTIAELGQGSIYTLTNSSTPQNREEFFKSGAPETAFFFSGPYFDIHPAMLKAGAELTKYSRDIDVVGNQTDILNRKELEPFKEGFDVVFEDTCFQMHAPNRAEQVAWVCQNLGENGLFIAWEKCSLDDMEEYQRREDMKDAEFKARYFSNNQVAEKKAGILTRMETGQVPLEQLVEGISKTLKHVAVTWNSGNFYIVVASNDPQKVKDFCSYLLPPCIPSQFQHMQLPQTLHGPDLNLAFRQPDKNTASPQRSNTGLPQAGDRVAPPDNPAP